jgi:hypothetical protein
VATQDVGGGLEGVQLPVRPGYRQGGGRMESWPEIHVFTVDSQSAS